MFKLLEVVPVAGSNKQRFNRHEMSSDHNPFKESMTEVEYNPFTNPKPAAVSQYDFVQQPDDQLICAVCLQPFVNPVELKPCGHVYCRVSVDVKQKTNCVHKTK